MFMLAVALDQLGRRLDTFSVPTTKKGYEDLLAWAEGFGVVRCAGVEGTSSYGAGLARYLRVMGMELMEVERPKRRHRRRNGKSDTRRGCRPGGPGQRDSRRAQRRRWPRRVE
jgi:transposase